ncbi:putative phospholipase B-like lamina ancestor [Amyelois transitella]|uniref:putative phospholipase B-like lamina ancestor n=1 Tax=Amyelois transitella TaxID=680683 RepID=UPI00067E520F|nr:putative phospholipase B-like lamina ancestor [Amyelois transitella]XP_013186925.1 putative phospholipase B-like lamina ancestor [Amyelois transitella]
MSKILKVVGASWMQTKISSYILGLLGILAILALFFGQMERSQEDGNYAATVFYNEKTGYSIEFWGQSNELSQIQRGVARAYFRMDIDTTGWSLLEVETEGSYPDEIQAYAAGIVEGALTWSLIHKHLENTIRAKCEGTPLEKQCNKLKDTLDKSVDKWKSYAADRSSTDPLWHQISLYYTQINGIFTGWKHGVERSMNEYDTDISDLYWLNSMAEVTEIQRILNITLEDSYIQAVPDLSTAFVRIANETSANGIPTKKLFLAQNKAGSYSSMTRILKRYKLNYHLTSKDTSIIPGKMVDFSGYPGSITSQDEFYLIRGEDHRLAVTGTPLRNFNDKLWKEVNITEQIPASPRIFAANHLAVNASSWGRVLASSNSGTAAKQWLVLDYSKFTSQHDVTPPHRQLNLHYEHIAQLESEINGVKHFVSYRNNSRGKGLLYLIEQIPGLTHSADISDVLLDQHYWASYGLPFFKDVATAVHITWMEEKFGNIFSSTDSPRALMFKRGYKNATSLDSIIKLMRQNNVTAINRASNGTSDCSGLVCLVEEEGYWSMLGVRGDIVQHNREAYGIIDTKVVYGEINETSVNFAAVAGPPYTEVSQVNNTKLNKGNIAPIYTHQFDNKPNIDGLQIKNLVLQQIEEAEQESLEILNRNAVKPFQWSTSDYKNRTHIGLPDTWAFTKFQPKWSW